MYLFKVKKASTTKTQNIILASILILLFILSLVSSARATLLIWDSCSSTSTIDFHPVNSLTSYYVTTTDFAEGNSAFAITSLGSYPRPLTTDYLTLNKFNNSFISSTNFVFGFWLREEEIVWNGTYTVDNWLRLTDGTDWVHVDYRANDPTQLYFTTSTTYASTWVQGTLASPSWNWIEIVYTAATISYTFYINGTAATTHATSLGGAAINANYYVLVGHGSGAITYVWGTMLLDGLAMNNVEGFPPVFPTTGTTGPSVNLLNIPAQLSIALGISVLTAGLLCGFMLELCFILPVLIFTDNTLVIMIMAILGLCTGVALGWLPYVCLILIILIVALLYAGKVRDLITGGATGEER